MKVTPEIISEISNFLHSPEKKALLLISDEIKIFSKTLIALFDKENSMTIIHINLLKTSDIGKQLPSLPANNATIVFFTGWGENGKLKNLYIKHQLDQYSAKTVFICKATILHPTLDPSLYFAPIIGTRIQKHLLKIIRYNSVNPALNTVAIPTHFTVSTQIDDKQQDLYKEHFLNKRLATKDPAMMRMVADRAAHDQHFKLFLFECLYASRKNKNLHVLAANAITALNYAKVSFSQMDLSDISLNGADLRKALLFQTNFSHTDLTDVNFKGANLEKANFSNAILSNIEIGEQISLHGDIDDPFNGLDINGNLLAVASARGWIHLWDIPSGEKLRTIKVSNGSEISPGYWIGEPIKTICFNPDGKILATAGGMLEAENVKLWDINSEEMLKEFSGHTKHINCVCFHPDGILLASCSYDKSVRIVNIVNETLVYEYTHDKSVNSVCFSPNGKYLVSGSDDGTARITELETFHTSHVFKSPSAGRVVTIAFNHNGKILATSDESRVNLWNFEDRSLIKVFDPLASAKKRELIYSIAFSPDEKLLAVATLTGAVWILNIADEKLSYILAEESSPCMGVKFISPILMNEETLIVSTFLSSKIQFLKFNELDSLISSPQHHTRHIDSITYHSGCKLLASGGEDGFMLWDMQQLILKKQFTTTDYENITAVCISPDGKFIAIAKNQSISANSVIILWDIIQNKIIHTLSASILLYSGRVSGLAFSIDSRFLFSGGWSSSIFIWDLQDNGKLIATLPYKNETSIGGCRCLCLNPSKSLLAAGIKNDIYVWDVTDPYHAKELLILSGHTENVESLSFHPNGKMLASGSWDESVCIWSLEAPGKFIHKITGQKGRVERVCFNPDGKLLIIGSYCQIDIINMETSKSIIQFIAHTDKIRGGITFINNNQFITASWDHSIRLWEISHHSDKFLVTQLWASHAIGTQFTMINITKAKNLSYKNHLLLKQHGAVDEDEQFHQHMRDILFSEHGNRKPIEKATMIKNDKAEYQALPSLPIELGSKSNVATFAFSPNGKLLAVTSYNAPVSTSPEKFFGSIRLYDTSTRKLLHNIQAQTQGIFAIGFSHKQNWLAFGDYEGLIIVRDLNINKVIYEFKGHSGFIHSIAFSPDDNFLVSASHDGTLRMWNIINNKLDKTYKTGHQYSQFWGAGFGPNGEWLVAIEGNDIHLLDRHSLELKHIFSDPMRDRIICLAIHPNGKWFISGPGNVNRNEKDLRLWDVENKTLVKQYKGPKRVVKSVAIHPNGEWIAASSVDNMLFLWHIKRTTPLLTFKVNVGSGSHVDFHPIDHYLTFVGEDNVVRRWNINYANLINNHRPNERITTDSATEYKPGSIHQLYTNIASFMADHKHNESTTKKSTPESEPSDIGSLQLFSGIFSRNMPHSIKNIALTNIIKKYNLSDSSQKSLEKALRQAAANNLPDDLKIIICEVKNINAQDENPKGRRCALHWAAEKRLVACIEILLAADAKINVTDAYGKTPIDYAPDLFEKILAKLKMSSAITTKSI